MPDHLGRDAKDFAIEFGGYLADAVEHFMSALNENLPDDDIMLCECDDLIRDHWAVLQSAIYEFRKRADRAKRRSAPDRPPADIMTSVREIARG